MPLAYSSMAKVLVSARAYLQPAHWTAALRAFRLGSTARTASARVCALQQCASAAAACADPDWLEQAMGLAIRCMTENDATVAPVAGVVAGTLQYYLHRIASGADERDSAAADAAATDVDATARSRAAAGAAAALARLRALSGGALKRAASLVSCVEMFAVHLAKVPSTAVAIAEFLRLAQLHAGAIDESVLASLVDALLGVVTTSKFFSSVDAARAARLRVVDVFHDLVTRVLPDALVLKLFGVVHTALQKLVGAMQEAGTKKEHTVGVLALLDIARYLRGAVRRGALSTNASARAGYARCRWWARRCLCPRLRFSSDRRCCKTTRCCGRWLASWAMCAARSLAR